MELKDFFMDFLRDYEQNRNISLQLERLKKDKYLDFISSYFSETLQNFADKICEAQRENCIINCKEANDHLTYLNGINNAKQPKINEL